MKVKMLEVRDAATFIPVMCVLMHSNKPEERYLLGRLGFSNYTHLVQLVWLGRERTEWDPRKWADRTMQTAHTYITENWETLLSGDVIDVEYILGEKPEPKKSERITSLYGGINVDE